MSTKQKFYVVLVILFFASLAAAQDSQQQTSQKDEQLTVPQQTKENKSGMEKFTDWFHNPTPWLSMNADIRWEWRNGWNMNSLNDDSGVSNWNFTLNRFRWGTKTKITDDIEFNHQWVWEFRTWDGPDTYSKHVDFSEIVWDKFNLTWRNAFDLPLTIVAGRQDIIFGKGWLVLEGTNNDEQRTIFFDALRFTYEMTHRDTTIDFILIDQRADTSAWLRPFSASKNTYVNNSDQQGIILYVTDKTIPNLQLEGYFIYKGEKPVASPSVKSEIYTVGGALSGPLGKSEHWRYRAEGAVQAGNKDGRSLLAFGTVDTLEYHFNDPHKNVLHATFEYLSGDDGSGRNGAFDPLWGHWPQWSWLNSYIYWYETSPSETTNLTRVNIGHSFWPTDKIQICTDYHALWANENTRAGQVAPNGLAWADTGKFRGHLFTALLNYDVTKQLKIYYLFEYFIPGDYYSEHSRDPAYIGKVNVEYTF